MEETLNMSPNTFESFFLITKSEGEIITENKYYHLLSTIYIPINLQLLFKLMHKTQRD